MGVSYDYLLQLAPNGITLRNKAAIVKEEKENNFSNPTTQEQNLADRVIRGEYYHPATHALWFYAPSSGEACKATWWDQENAVASKSLSFVVYFITPIQ